MKNARRFFRSDFFIGMIITNGTGKSGGGWHIDDAGALCRPFPPKPETRPSSTTSAVTAPYWPVILSGYPVIWQSGAAEIFSGKLP